MIVNASLSYHTEKKHKRRDCLLCGAGYEWVSLYYSSMTWINFSMVPLAPKELVCHKRLEYMRPQRTHRPFHYMRAWENGSTIAPLTVNCMLLYGSEREKNVRKWVLWWVSNVHTVLLSSATQLVRHVHAGTDTTPSSISNQRNTSYSDGNHCATWWCIVQLGIKLTCSVQVKLHELWGLIIIVTCLVWPSHTFA